MRIGVAAIHQESNTFSPVLSDFDDFAVHGFYAGEEVREQLRGTNTEVGGALSFLESEGETAVPLIRAWAQSSGRLSDAAFQELGRQLSSSLDDAVPLDGLILALHGAMVTETIDSADAELVAIARRALGPSVPIAVCLDLHANVTRELSDQSDILIGYKTHPHVDMYETGVRTARLLVSLLRGESAPTHALEKRPMLVPAEAMLTSAGPMRVLREEARALESPSVLDISFFPVQPWLDVPELGFGVVVTCDGNAEEARILAQTLASRVWERRREFRLELLSPEDAVRRAKESSIRPFLISESADSPSAGAAADSPVMIDALLRHGQGLTSLLTTVDAPAVAECFEAGVGATLNLEIGCTVDSRFHEPVSVTGRVGNLGSDPVTLTGPSFTGTKFSMGRWAVLHSGSLALLLTERAAYTSDPQTFRHVGLDPESADVVVVRSATQFRAGYPAASADAAVILDVEGASTPSFDRLRFTRLSEALYPLVDREEFAYDADMTGR
jgi:microcystin degradation protein MlrC